MYGDTDLEIVIEKMIKWNKDKSEMLKKCDIKKMIKWNKDKSEMLKKCDIKFIKHIIEYDYNDNVAVGALINCLLDEIKEFENKLKNNKIDTFELANIVNYCIMINAIMIDSNLRE